jgi:hypothetical protein
MNPQDLPLRAAVEACRAETAKFWRREASNDAFCLELFRRAICEADSAAWESVFDVYRSLVAAWIKNHPAAAVAADESAYWLNRAFERFWQALAPERFETFATLAALLRYLKMCVHSVLLDEVRRQRATADTLDLDTAEAEPGPAGPERALDRLASQELWQAIERELGSDAERLVAYLSFALEYKPGEIYARHSAQFTDVKDVYRIKRDLIDRLRRSQGVRAFLS